MHPYRTSSNETPRAIVRIGDNRHRSLVTIASLVLIGLTLASILGACFYGDHGDRIHGSVLTPAILGVALLFRRRTTSTEYIRDLRELHIEFASIMRRRQIRVPVEEITGLTITSPRAKQSDAEHELHLLRKGERPLLLSAASDAAQIEPARATVSSFLLENGLLHGELEVEPSARLRITEDTEIGTTTYEPSVEAGQRRAKS